MAKFWNTKEFKSLRGEWYKKLEESDFKSIEDNNGRLWQPNLRTITFDNRGRILDFFLKLDSFLTNSEGLPSKHRRILELYSQGVKIKGAKGIIERVGMSDKYIRNVINYYKRLLIEES